MATSTEIVADALRELNIVRIGGTPTAAQTQDGIRALNAMLSSYRALGLDLDDNDLPLDKRHEQALIALLAVRLATPYGRPISPELARRARDGWIGLQAEFYTVPSSDFERGIKYTPSQRNFTGAE